MRKLLLTLAVLLPLGMHGQEIYTFVTDAQNSPPDGICSGGIPGAGSLPPKKILRVTLASLDRLTVGEGDVLTYSLLIENISDAPYLIPVGSSLALVKRTNNYTSSRLQLYFLDRENERQFVTEGVATYGSEEVSGTTRELKPGGQIWFRVTTRLKDWVVKVKPEGRSKLFPIVETIKTESMGDFQMHDRIVKDGRTNCVPARREAKEYAGKFFVQLTPSPGKGGN